MSPCCALIRRIDKSTLSNHYQKLVKGLLRCHASILAQLRLGHAPLNQHLHRLKCIESPLCPACKMEEETVAHYLIMCPAFRKHRIPLQYELKCEAKSISTLLNDPEALRPLFRYMNRTKCFQEGYRVLELPPKKDDKKK